MITVAERAGTIKLQPSGHTVIERQLVISENGKEIAIYPLPDRVIEPGEEVPRDDPTTAAVVTAHRNVRKPAVAPATPISAIPRP